jgi:hypothetical protein
MRRLKVYLLTSSLFFIQASAALAGQPTDLSFKAALDRVNSHYDQQINVLLTGIGPELSAIKAKALKDPTLGAAVDTVKNTWLPAVSEATAGVREKGRKYYEGTIQPKLDESSMLTTASDAKTKIVGKLKSEIEGLNRQRNNDLRAIYSQNKIPLPTSLRGD